MKKEDIKIPELQNVEVDAEHFPQEWRDLIEKQGEEPFLRRLIGLIRRNVKLNVNFTTGRIEVRIAGQIVAERTIKK